MKKYFSKVLSFTLAFITVVMFSTTALAALPAGVPSALEKPTLVKIELMKDDDGFPYFVAQIKFPQSVLQLDREEVAGGSVFWDYAVKIDDGTWSDFGCGGYIDVYTESENALVPGTTDTYSVRFDPIDEGTIDKIDIKNHLYSYKIKLNFGYYEGWPDIEPIYSPESNVVTIGSGSFYSDSSSWAEAELNKAYSYGLIPQILMGADMTKPITREEFCELAILLYEKSTSKSVPVPTKNPFTDTTNPQILKAYSIGITSGTSATTFSPNTLINREQCASMLYRAIKAIKPDGDFSISNVKDFPDQKKISSWAAEAAKYMSKIGVIKGDAAGNFMPKATTSAETASGYGMATREAATMMASRSYEAMPTLPTIPND